MALFGSIGMDTLGSEVDRLAKVEGEGGLFIRTMDGNQLVALPGGREVRLEGMPCAERRLSDILTGAAGARAWGPPADIII